MIFLWARHRHPPDLLHVSHGHLNQPPETTILAEARQCLPKANTHHFRPRNDILVTKADVTPPAVPRLCWWPRTSNSQLAMQTSLQSKLNERVDIDALHARILVTARNTKSVLGGCSNFSPFHLTLAASHLSKHVCLHRPLTPN